jgi:hypothetical protein
MPGLPNVSRLQRRGLSEAKSSSVASRSWAGGLCRLGLHAERPRQPQGIGEGSPQLAEGSAFSDQCRGVPGLVPYDDYSEPTVA